MCRIAGIYTNDANNLTSDILRMRDAMHRGGPDGAGLYLDENFPLALAHRRLALIDLSEAGNQPMANTNNNTTIAFNGEIYNFQAIKEELLQLGYSFNTLTDTEVILKAYEHWGKSCFEQFNGMFALAIWDKKRQEILLARDHAGIKPLYYHISNNSFVFASEIRAFKAYKPNWTEHPHWRIPFLAYGHLPEPFTTLAQVQSLPKGTVLTVHIPTLQASQHTFFKYKYECTITDEATAVAQIKSKVTDSVASHLISDAPIGVFLSGGVDSSILTILAAQSLSTQLKTLSIIFEDEAFSEAPYQQMIVEKTGVQHHSFLVTDELFKAHFNDIMEAMDQPSTDGINAYFISKFAKEYGLTAVLSGLGADELLGGYDTIRRSALVNRLQKLPAFLLATANLIPNDKVKRIGYLSHNSLSNTYLFNRGLYTQQQIATILSIPITTVQQVLQQVQVTPCNSSDIKQIAAHLDEHLYMQNQLLKDTDIMSMWHGIEVRVPFLDKALIQCCQSIHPNIKFNTENKPKHLLIEAFKDVLPEAVWNRKKQGFTFPFVHWMGHIIPTERNAVFCKRLANFNAGKIHWSKYWAYLLMQQTGTTTLIFLHKFYKNVRVLNLDAFATTGGIEKYNRCMLKALNTLEKKGNIIAQAASLHDDAGNAAYFPTQHYRTYNGNVLACIYNEIIAASKTDIYIIGHINLSIIGLLVKCCYPSKKIVLITHGIEVWQPLKYFKKRLLHQVNEIWSVSNYTKHTMAAANHLPLQKINVFHNTIDPHFVYPTNFNKPNYLLERYKLQKHQDAKIIFTLTRLSFKEKYKGYDLVLKAISSQQLNASPFIYIIAGKADAAEQARIDRLIKEYQLENKVIITGFLPENEIEDHYKLADMFVMPSQKEGFGIVFIEAMACGLPIIAGNKDGSVDALQNGELGTLINPDKEEELITALKQALKSNSIITEKQQLQQKVKLQFGFEKYTNNLEVLLT